MKKITLFLILAILITSFCPSAHAAQKLPVLMYHNVTNDPAMVQKDADVHIMADVFEEHLVSLKAAGYTAISLDEYYMYRTGKGTLPPKCVLITFDDGYSSNFDIAYPLLKKHNTKAVIFVIASRMGAKNVEFPHFSWAEAREMEKSGLVEIESHTFTHADFSNINYAQTVVEMRLSKFAIETNLGKKCRFFAYPYGKMNQASTAVAKSAGYSMVFVGRDVSADIESENLYEMPRYTAKGTYSGADIINIIEN